MKNILTLFPLLCFASFGYCQCVTDTIPPIANCANITLQLSNTGIATLTPIFINNQSTDNCGIDSMLVNGQDSLSFTCADIGINLVTLYVVDAFGNSSTCVSNVTVMDTIAPTVNCYNTTVQLSNNGAATIVPISISNSSDNCIISSTLVNGQASYTFNCADIGVHPVTVSTMDASGNISTCVSNVTVMDTIAPTVNCYNTTVQLSNNGAATIVPISISNSSDNCIIGSTLVNGQASYTFNCADIGVHPVTVSAMDASGNINTCVSNVTVMDTIAPIASCMNTTLYLSNNGIATLTPNQIDNGSSDNCGISSFLINGQVSDTFNCTNVGIVSSALLTVTDFSGNSSSCLANITTIDVTAPIAICQNINLYLSNNGIATVSANQIDTGSFDNCGILSTFINGQPANTFDCSDIGVNAVVLSVVDFSGNMDSCSSTVTVIDTVTPIANCQNITLNLSSNGIATVSANQINNGSIDNCGISSFLINSDTFDCSDVGINSVVLTVTDFSGNLDSCSSNIIVTDSLSFCALSNSTIHQIEESIHIYPNPTAQILNISSKESLLQQITLTSITGQVVLTQNEAGSQNTAQLDLSNLPNAVYLITVITNKGISTQKIIVQH